MDYFYPYYNYSKQACQEEMVKMTKLSERLYSLRKERNLTQLRAAEGMGIPFSTYRRYEKKEREPDASVLVQIADFYDVSLDYLVGRSEKRER